VLPGVSRFIGTIENCRLAPPWASTPGTIQRAGERAEVRDGAVRQILERPTGG
jgi:hypothetical protein